MPQNFTFDKEQLAFDRDHLWHPYTSLTKPLPTYPVVGANGVRLELDSGKKLIDGMSSWWTAIHGYNVSELNQVAKEQLERMSHVMFGGITHQPAIELGKRLVSLTPAGLEKVFICDSGSVSVEVAMKMAIQYQHSKGKNRAKFMTFKNGYHGDTSGAMSVCDPENGMHHLFAEFFPKHHFLDAPIVPFDEDPDEQEIQKIEIFFNEHAKNSAAFILEPVVQGAGGMRVYSPTYLEIIRRLCTKYNLLLIADEIATGFGRTGKMFACEHANISPDIICLGKALTGGYLSLAATLCTKEVSDVICNGEAGVFMHGPTFMANPLACAISVRSIDLLLASGWKEKISFIESVLKQELYSLQSLASVKHVRVLGAIGVVEMKSNVEVVKAQKFFVKNGVWIRPFRNLIYIMPPYIITEKDLKALTKVMGKYCSLLPRSN